MTKRIKKGFEKIQDKVRVISCGEVVWEGTQYEYIHRHNFWEKKKLISLIVGPPLCTWEFILRHQCKEK